MQITMKTADLVRELSLLEKIAAKKATLPILSNVLIRTLDNNQQVEFSTTDLEIALTCTCAAQVAKPGVVTLPVKKLLDLARTQSDASVSLGSDSDTNTIQFASGQFRSRLQSAAFPEDFPKLPEFVANGNAQLPRALAKSLLSQVRFAISDKDQQQYFLKGSLLSMTDKKLAFVATDSGRLAISSAARHESDENKTIIPVKAVDELLALLNESGDKPVEFTKTDQHLFFRIENRLLTSNRIDGEFPAYEKIIPADDSIKIRVAVNRLQLASVIKRHILISDIIKMSIGDKVLNVTSASAEGDSVEPIAIGYTGEPISLQFRGQYVLDFLNEASGDMVVLALQSETMPAMFVDGNYLNVIMPMRVQ